MNVGTAITSTATDPSSFRNGLVEMKAGTNLSEPFGGLFKDAVAQVDGLESQARAAVVGLMTGSGVDVHQAVIAAQKADMAFDLALSIRNKAMQAYQSVMGMQF